MAKLILGQMLAKRKLSKRQFAKRLGIDYSGVFQFFRPGYNPTLKTLTRWAQALGCKVRDLIKE
jgi:transcriptional regulator with XRE-family HTH domain